MQIPRPQSVSQLLLTATLPLFLIFGSATAGQHDGTASPIRLTEITQNSHPFETLYCARQPVQVRFFGQLAELVINDESRLLRQARSASGARYIDPGDETTVFWGKGAFATITWSGQTLPQCAPSGAIIPPYRTTGNEPFWSVEYDGWDATLKRPGKPDVTSNAQIVESSAQGQTLVAESATEEWKLQATDGLCQDTMSGMSYPQQVTLHYQSGVMQGCGGNTERLLQGATWHVTHINEQMIDSTAGDTGPAQIQFLANNNIAGNSGCNRFFGRYALTGETLTLNNIGSTRMACPEGMMARETTLLKILQSVDRFSFEESDINRLQLHTHGTTVIRATAQTM